MRQIVVKKLKIYSLLMMFELPYVALMGLLKQIIRVIGALHHPFIAITHVIIQKCVTFHSFSFQKNIF